MKLPLLVALCVIVSAQPRPSGASTAPDDPLLLQVAFLPAHKLSHRTGQRGADGWEVDRRKNRAGPLMEGPEEPIVLPAGVYRATVRLRRGRYPDDGMLHGAIHIARFELRDGGAAFVGRDLDVSEFPRPNRYENRWIEFSVSPGSQRELTVALEWHGTVNAEIESVRIERIPIDPPDEMAARVRRMDDRLRLRHLENGFVVSRKANGDADETGDATTYTGFRVAALAWEAALEPARPRDALHEAVRALRSAVDWTNDEPVIARFVDEAGRHHPEETSKDAYASFFFAAAMAHPHITDHALRDGLADDVRRIATRLLTDGFVVRRNGAPVTSFAPHYSEDDIRRGINKLVNGKDRGKKAAQAIRRAARFAPFQPLLPGLRDVLRALDERDEARLYDLALPTADGMVTLAGRVVEILREHGRRDLLGPALNRDEPPSLRLAQLMTDALSRLPPADDGRRFRRPSDLRFLASNALVALHVVRSAAAVTGDPHFEEYYRNNLFTQDALLQTALDWHGLDDDLIRSTGGNAAAARERRGYLALLSTYNLYRLETNPALRDAYRAILEREASAGRHDDNPLLAAIATACDANGDPGAVWKALTLYPDVPDGFGPAFWREEGKNIARRLAGGDASDASIEPLPVSHRPRDSFLWQRNVRRLAGDEAKAYPGNDFVFLYWLARRHGLVEPPGVTRVAAP